MRRRMVYRPGFEGSPLRTAVSTSRMRDVPTLGPAPAAQANSFGLIRISDALSRLSILAIARLLDSVNFNSLGRQASTVAVLYGRLIHFHREKLIAMMGIKRHQEQCPNGGNKRLCVLERLSGRFQVPLARPGLRLPESRWRRVAASRVGATAPDFAQPTANNESRPPGEHEYPLRLPV